MCQTGKYRLARPSLRKRNVTCGDVVNCHLIWPSVWNNPPPPTPPPLACLRNSSHTVSSSIRLPHFFFPFLNLPSGFVTLGSSFWRLRYETVLIFILNPHTIFSPVTAPYRLLTSELCAALLLSLRFIQTGLLEYTLNILCIIYCTMIISTWRSFSFISCLWSLHL